MSVSGDIKTDVYRQMMDLQEKLKQRYVAVSEVHDSSEFNVF